MLVLRAGKSAEDEIKIRCGKPRPTIRLNHRGPIISTRSAICKPAVAAGPCDPDNCSVAASILAEGVGFEPTVGLPHARFRVECLKPDSATLPLCGAHYRAQPKQSKQRPGLTRQVNWI